MPLLVVSWIGTVLRGLLRYSYLDLHTMARSAYVVLVLETDEDPSVPRSAPSVPLAPRSLPLTAPTNLAWQPSHSRQQTMQRRLPSFASVFGSVPTPPGSSSGSSISSVSFQNSHYDSTDYGRLPAIRPALFNRRSSSFNLY